MKQPVTRHNRICDFYKKGSLYVATENQRQPSPYGEGENVSPRVSKPSGFEILGADSSAVCLFIIYYLI